MLNLSTEAELREEKGDLLGEPMSAASEYHGFLKRQQLDMSDFD